MSWISDLAGRAENILNKIDQNAAIVLKTETGNSSNNSNIKNSVVQIEDVKDLKRNLSSNSLSLVKSLSPKKLLKGIEQQFDENDENNVQKIEKFNSRLSSRRSSLSSRADSTVIECEISLPIDPGLINEQQTEHNNVEKEISDLRIALAEITSERNDLKDEVIQLQQEIKEARGFIRIQELENLITELQHERENLNTEVAEMKNNCFEYVKSITELETNLSKARQTILELSEKLEWQTKETNQHRMEFEQYRKKAQATLQMKEKIISELRGKDDRNNDEFLESDTEKILQMEIDGLRQENSNLNDELKLLRTQLEETKKITQQFELKLKETIKGHTKSEDTIRELLNREQKKALQFESDVKILNQELITVRNEMHNQRQLFSIKLHEKENEIIKLHDANQSQQNGYSKEDILEDRIESLTQALVQKQNTIESVTAERSALKLQLERTEDKIRQMVAQNKVNNFQLVNVNHTDDVKAQLPYLMRENPFDTNVTRRVKRAYSSLDSAGIRIGVFLRRYPLVRIMVFIYVALLHLWVMFVLLSSTPS